MFSNLLSDIRLAIRAMRRQSAFTAVVVGTLALGIGANTAMFAIVHAALLKPLPYPDPGRLVIARPNFSGRLNTWSSAPDYYDYEAQIPGFESLAACFGAENRVTLRGTGGPEHVAALQVSHHLFSTLGVRPAAGRWFTADEGAVNGPDVAMIGEQLANRLFGSATQAVGRKLVFAGAVPPSTIVGVMPASFQFWSKAEVWRPAQRGVNDGPATRAFHNWVVVGRLRAGVSIEGVQRQADVVARRLERDYPESNKSKGLTLTPLHDVLLGSQASMLIVLMGAVGVVLLIACANVAGLLVARGIARRSELAVRGALGASRARIATQLVTESLVLAAIAGVAGVLLSFWLQRLLPVAAGLADSGIDVPRGVQAPVMLFAVAVSLLTGLVSGLVPALRASSPQLAAQLAPGSRATESRGGARLRSVLVAGQVALSLVLLVGAGLLVRSFARIASTDLGFNARGLLVATFDQPDRTEAGRLQFQRALSEELRAIRGVTQIALTESVPILHPSGDPPAWPAGHPPADMSEQRTVLRRIVTPGYFKAMGMPLLAGRDFLPTDRQGTPNVTVIDETTAREFYPGMNPLGQRLMVTAMRMGLGLGDPLEFEVIGVVRGARISRVGVAPRTTAYFSSEQFPMGRVNVMLRTSIAPPVMTQTIRKLITTSHPDTAVDELVTMDEIIGDTLVSRRVMAVTLGAFSGVALLLAALGLYGVLAFYVSQRSHEIGVRMALGAGRRTIVMQVLGRSAMLVVPGLTTGILVSRSCSRLMRQFMYQVQPTDTATYVVVGISLASVAFLASLWPALHATRVDPVQALRGE